MLKALKLVEPNFQDDRIAYLENLKKITHLIHSAENVDEILFSIKDSIASLLNVERITIFTIDPKRDEIYSKAKIGHVPKEIRVPVNKRSIAGYVAYTGTPISINNAYSKLDLMAIYPDLCFDESWDKKSGIKTKQILAHPLLYKNTLLGVVQVINKKAGDQITPEDRSSLWEIANVLGLAIYNKNKRLPCYRTPYDYLLENKIITSELLDQATFEAQKRKVNATTLLLTQCEIPSEEMSRSLSAYYHLPFFNFENDALPTCGLITKLNMKNRLRFMRHHSWVPVAKNDGVVILVIDDPADANRTSDIRLIFKDKNFEFHVGFHRDIHAFLDKVESEFEKTGKSGTRDNSLKGESKSEEVDPEQNSFDEGVSVKKDESGMIGFVNQIILEAFERGVSDIHLETNRNKENTIIRFRQDGECFTFKEVPSSWRKALISRVKIMANLNIAERRLPQDGKIRLTKGSHIIELRVATIPTFGNNEDAVLRILAASKPLLLDQLNLSEKNIATFSEIIQKPYGIFLVVGPTGSGKTTTLHSALGHINKPNKKIWTAEDPVEITQPGLRQVQIRTSIDLTFANVLRAFLRADPDVIMIGEMRDRETVKMGIEASLTGHLVFSTLHTNSAAETVVRLIDLGVDPFGFADALLGILAQRLVKTLCSNCKEKYTPSSKEIENLKQEVGQSIWDEMEGLLSQKKICRPKGCSKCHQTGYKGRTGLHEMLSVSPELRQLIQNQGTSDEIRKMAVTEGMRTLKQDGILKVLRGDTTIEKVRSVCSI